MSDKVCSWCGSTDVPPPDGPFDCKAWELCSMCRVSFWWQVKRSKEQAEKDIAEKAEKGGK